MALFGKKKDDEEYEDEDEFDGEDGYSDEDGPRKIRDLKPKNKKKRKEPPKPWGKKERLIVAAVLATTALVAAFLAISARGFRFPELPKINLNIFSGETITLQKDDVK